MSINLVEESITLMIFTTPRLLAAMSVMPFLSRNFFGGALIRNGIVLSLSIFLFPVVDAGYQPFELSPLLYGLIIAKEAAIGFCLGWLASLPFWALEGVGFFIDNQRGSTMASALNPLTGSQASPIGILLVQSFMTIFFLGGNFLMLLKAIYTSYAMWPVFSFFPHFHVAGIDFFMAQLSYLMYLIVVFSAPIIVAMFLSELGLGLVSRFAPQLNVFFLAMPIKSIIATAMLTFYVAILMSEFSTRYLNVANLFTSVFELWDKY
ncbi:MAG: type III secretion system export apparatus subunit SctT [Reinekea sp.]|jgi:type III secretion protein T